MKLEKRDIVFILFAALITGFVIFYPNGAKHAPEPKIDLSEPVTTSTTVNIP